jgi:hypothetical protein
VTRRVRTWPGPASTNNFTPSSPSNVDRSRTDRGHGGRPDDLELVAAGMIPRGPHGDHMRATSGTGCPQMTTMSFRCSAATSSRFCRSTRRV